MSREKKDGNRIKEERNGKVTIGTFNSEPPISLVPVYNGGFEKFPAVTSAAVALREARRIKDTSFDRLWKYLYDPKKEVQLSDQEQEQMRRLSNAWDLLTAKVLNDRKAVRAHTQWCKTNCMDISERTAYDDIRRAKALYGDPRVNLAVLEKARISNVILDLIEIAKAKGDLDNAQRLIRRYNAVNGLEEDIKTKLPRPAITINFNADEETLKRQQAELMEGVTLDIDHQDADED